MSETLRGTVKWFNDAKGFGFIENPSGDVFVHYSVIESGGFKTLKDGEEVEYQLEQGDKGLHAKRVTRVNPPKEEAKPQASKGRKPKSGLAAQIEVTRTDSASENGIAEPMIASQTAPTAVKVTE